MRDRITIRRTAPGRWSVRTPPFGFGQGETAHHATHTEAVHDADRRIRRDSSNVATTESAWQPTDRVSTTPAWSPLVPAERDY